MHTPDCLKNKSGFSLVEAFIAMSILVFCTTAIFASLYIGFTLVNDIRENIIASSVIQQKIEDLRKAFFSVEFEETEYGEKSFADDPPYEDLLAKLNSDSTKTSATVKIDPYIDSNIVRVVVTVVWYLRLNISKENVKKAMTLITRNGINSTSGQP